MTRRCPTGGWVAGSQHVREAGGQQRALRHTSAHASSFGPPPPPRQLSAKPAPQVMCTPWLCSQSHQIPLILVCDKGPNQRGTSLVTLYFLSFSSSQNVC